ncbi:MAG TPA: hypothetical protein VIC27_01075, partial [Ktedonobacterales bacterium]
MASLPPVPPGAAVDLHLHTRYSDGAWRPADLFGALAQQGFRLVSVVDHDQFDHLPEVMALRTSLLRLEADADLRARLGQMGRARALSHFTNDAAANNIIRVY